MTYAVKIDIDAVLRRYDDNKTLAEVAAASDAKPWAVRKIIAAHGRMRDHGTGIPARLNVADLVRAYQDDGMTSREIIKRFRCDWMTARTALKDAGVSIRPRGRQKSRHA